jgi:hypothetical protein
MSESFGVGGTAANWNGTHQGRGVKVMMLRASVYFPIDLGARGKTLEGRTQFGRRIGLRHGLRNALMDGLISGLLDGLREDLWMD